MSQKVIIESCRLSYPALFKPHETQEGGDLKYQATVLIPKTDTKTLQAVNAAIQAEWAEAVQPNGAWKGAQPPAPTISLYDGDQVQPRSGKPWGDECKGCMVLRTSSASQPDIVDEFGNKAMDATKFYAGCYCHYSVTFKAYNNKQLGIGAYLNCVMFAGDGEPLEARASAKDDFAGLIAARGTQMPGMPAAPAAMGVPSQMPGMPANSAAMGMQPPTPAPAQMPAPTAGGYGFGMPAAAPAPAAPVQMPTGFGGFYPAPGRQ